jgi:transcriptional regulator with XRE-family HTH domain
MGLPDRITKGCEVKGLSKAELSRLIGVKPQQITEISQQKHPSKHLRTIAEILGVPVEWLTTGAGPAPSWWNPPDAVAQVSGVPSQIPLPNKSPEPAVDVLAQIMERLKKLDELEEITKFMQTIKEHLGISDEKPPEKWVLRRTVRSKA